MTITENQAIEMAREAFGVELIVESDKAKLHRFANLACASVEAENVKLRRLIERMISATDTTDAEYWSNEYDRHQSTSTEHLDAIVAERVRELTK